MSKEGDYAKGQKDPLLDVVIEVMNERFERMRMELREELAHAKQQNSGSVNGEEFYRIQSYVSTLIQVQGVEHNVHTELTEAIEKLKKLTYQP